MIREDFGESSASSTSWTVERDVKEVVFALSDASGETTFSGMSHCLYVQLQHELTYRSTTNPCVIIIRSQRG
jgi:hypothetical protein